MSKNVQELAEELGIDKNELAAMINGMSLGLMGVTGSTILTPMDVERIKKKHQAEKNAPKEPKVKKAPEKATAAPVRRRAKADGAVAPVRRRRKKVDDVKEEEPVAPVRRRTATGVSPANEEEDSAPAKPKVRSRRKVVTVKTVDEAEELLGGESVKPKEPRKKEIKVVEASPIKEEVEAKAEEVKEVEEKPLETVAQNEPETEPAESNTTEKVEEKKTVAPEPEAKKEEKKKKKSGYAAKIVHRPGTPGDTSKEEKPIDVEPIQQTPPRRTSAKAKTADVPAENEVAKTTPKHVEEPPKTSLPKEDKESFDTNVNEQPTIVKAKIKTRPEPLPEIDPDMVPPPEKPSSRRKSSRKKSGATIVKKMEKSVVLDRLSAEGKDFTPGPKRQSSHSGRRESGRRGRKRIVEGTDLYGNSSRRKVRKGQKQKKKPQKTKITEAAEHKRVIRVEDAITVGDLAHRMGVKPGVVSMKLLEAGMMTTINTIIDYETAAIIAEEFNHTVENVAFDIGEFYDTDPDPEETLEPRAPVVTVMGHVDHGKTSLLDAIRSSTIASGEAGGITQHIGAYQVKLDSGVITFLDTPGHEAFTALRARGAKATDITVLVVAADDGVMPQTVEAINHSQAAKVPIVVAINKIDKPGANVDRVKQALTEYQLVAEEWGGSTLFVEVSAKQHTHINELIDAIMLQAELLELRANPNRDAQGLVIEAQLDVGRGSVATVLVQRGTLKQGDIMVSGQYYGKVRTMTNDLGELVDAAFPSQPIEITGLGGVPAAGEPFFVVQEEKDAKRICQNVIDQRRKEKLAARAKESAFSLEDLSAMIKEGELKELKVILKGDVQGSVEAIKQAFSKLGNNEVGVSVIHSGVGGITENDVNLAASAEKGAVVVGFNVRPDNRAQTMAEKYGVKILTHSIIYDAIEQIRILLEGMLEPIIEEETIGSAEVRDIFTAPKVGTVAGCYITDGIVRRGAKARVVRDSRIIYDSTIESLRRFKDNVNEVKAGFECGLSIENYNDVRIGDTIECYTLKEVAAKLQ